jgi:uncharacterized integral membrane protein (TIGR00698 family)
MPYIQKIVFLLLAALCLTPWVSPPVALAAGIVVANTLGNPFKAYTGKLTKMLLQVSVVGLGFGMSVGSALAAGKQGVLFTVVSIMGTLILGYLLGKALKINTRTSQLISAGTAICGGSAIAAIAPVIGADEEQISVSLGTVFILNAIALFTFPTIGHYLQMTQQQFGLWAAIAIHDTSSVVGAGAKYGPEALQIATTIKLARALWIIPLSLVTALIAGKSGGKIKIPWFIGYFILALLLNSYVPAIKPVAPYIVMAARAGLTLTLFLIGAGLSLAALKKVGVKPLLQGVILWVGISAVSLWVIMGM